MSILFGLLLVAAGTLMIVKTEPIFSFTGASRWAENNLGTEGGTRLLIKLIGVAVVLIGLATMTGLINGLLEFIARLLVPGT